VSTRVLQEGSQARPIWLQRVWHPQGWQLAHAHHVREITLTLRGRGRITVEGSMHTLTAGTFYYVASQVPHDTVAESPGIELMVLHFWEASPRLEAALAMLAPFACFRAPGTAISEFVELWHRLLQELSGDLPYAQEQCQLCIGETIILLLRSYQRSRVAPLAPHQQQAMEQAIHWMHEQVLVPLSVAALANHLGFSPAQFRLLFRRYTGVSPKRYQLAVRIRQGQALLRDPQRSVTEVARLVGFGTPQEFAQAFRALVGVGPSQWRKALWQEEFTM
jgi:AraC-like DNA-binding protein